MSNTRQRTAGATLDIVWDWFKNYLFLFVPTVPAVATWIVANSKAIPPWQAIPLAVFVFWALSHTLKNLAYLSDRSQINHKVMVVGANGSRHVEHGRTVGLQVSFSIANQSTQLVAYEVVNIRTSIEGRINPNPVKDSVGALITPNSNATFYDASVLVDDLKIGSWHHGEAEIHIIYGRPGKLRYSDQRKYKISFLLNSPITLDSFQARTI